MARRRQLEIEEREMERQKLLIQAELKQKEETKRLEIQREAARQRDEAERAAEQRLREKQTQLVEYERQQRLLQEQQLLAQQQAQQKVTPVATPKGNFIYISNSYMLKGLVAPWVATNRAQQAAGFQQIQEQERNEAMRQKLIEDQKRREVEAAQKATSTQVQFIFI